MRAMILSQTERRIVALTLAGCALSAACHEASPAVPVQRTSALLITMDTTRADAIGCFGGPAGVTPTLDALAREGVAYTAARTVAPITLPAHSSMMTGLYPVRHTVRDNGVNALPAAAQTIAERARAAGVQTGAVVGAVVLDASWGIGQGFDFFDSRPYDAEMARLHIPDRPAREVVAVARDWLRKRDPTRPFFLWVHLFEPHAPYEPPPEFLAQAHGDKYLGEVATMDHAIGDLIDELRADGSLEHTLVVAVGDHGESLNQHGEASHGVFCFETTIRVPLIVRHPDGWHAGVRSSEIVSVVDVFPTVCDALGLGASTDVDGMSLFHREVPPDRGVYFESYYGYMNFGWSPLVGFADARGKLIQGVTPTLFRPETDRLETTDVAASNAADVARYRAAVAQVAARRALESTAGDAVDRSLATQIQALGYAGVANPSSGVPAPLEITGRMDPHTRLQELKDYQAAEGSGSRGQRSEAIASLERIVADNPLNASALDQLASNLVEEHRCAEAATVLERLSKLGLDQAKRFSGLGRCFELQGDGPHAIASFRRAVALHPGSGPEIVDLARALERAGSREEAAAVRATLRQSPQTRR